MCELSKADYQITDSGEFFTDRKWIMPKREKKAYELLYVKNGKIYIKDKDKKYELSGGDLIILKPDVVYEGYSYSDGETSFCWLIFELKKQIGLPSVLRDFPGVGLIGEILHIMCLPEKNEILLDGAAKHLFASVLSAQRLENVPNTSFCDEIIEWIRINADAQLSVKSVAEHFGYNPEYLTRIIKNRYNIGIKAIIDECVIKKANDYLERTDYSIKEISELLKFSSPSLFSNFYKYHKKTVPHLLRD